MRRCIELSQRDAKSHISPFETCRGWVFCVMLCVVLIIQSSTLSLHFALQSIHDFIEKSVSLFHFITPIVCIHHSCLNLIISNSVCFSCFNILLQHENNDNQFCCIFQYWNFTPKNPQYRIKNSGLMYSLCASTWTCSWLIALHWLIDVITTTTTTRRMKQWNCQHTFQMYTFTFDLDVVWSFV